MDITQWAAQLMTENDWAVLDTETTGLSDIDEIIDIAILDGISGRVLVNQLIRPFHKISPDATKVHGITAEHLVGAPSFAQAWPEIFRALAPYRRVVTYNADFDARMLRQSCYKAGIFLFTSKRAEQFAAHWRRGPIAPRLRDYRAEALPLDWECLMRKYAEYYGRRGRYGEPKWVRLQEACEQQQVSVEDLAFHRWHRAWVDCMAARSLIKVLAEKASKTEPSASPASPASMPEVGVEVFDLEKGRIL